MAAHLTAAEARALGITAPAGRTRTTRKAAPGHGRSRCYDCGQLFTTAAAETRHVAAGHCRYESVLTPTAYDRTMTDTDPTPPSPDPDQPVIPDADDDDDDDDDGT